MTKDEALRLALEALETLTDCYDNNAVGIEIDAIKAIKEALETKDEQRIWVKLTDEEIESVYMNTMN